MAVAHVSRIEASSAELVRLAAVHGGSGSVARGVEALAQMLIDRMRGTAGRTVTLGPQDVEAVQRAADERGVEVAGAFKKLLEDALAGSIEVNGKPMPVLLLDDVAREQLANYAGSSSYTD